MATCEQPSWTACEQACGAAVRGTHRASGSLSCYTRVRAVSPHRHLPRAATTYLRYLLFATAASHRATTTPRTGALRSAVPAFGRAPLKAASPPHCRLSPLTPTYHLSSALRYLLATTATSTPDYHYDGARTPACVTAPHASPDGTTAYHCSVCILRIALRGKRFYRSNNMPLARLNETTYSTSLRAPRMPGRR